MAGNTSQTKKSKHSIPIDILDDLCSRFIINLPPEDRGNLVRICFQIELAHWFYLDYYCTDESNNLNPCGIREFAAHIFQHVPTLREHVQSLDAVLDNWREYKLTVPTYGAILLDEDMSHVLLVQSYWTKASWGFPKGKVNEDEEPWKCASREVLEETGFDISKLINKNEYVEAVIHEQIVRLYIIPYIPHDTKFQPQTRNEIKACEWFALTDLPSNKKDMTPKHKMGVSPNAFFMVLPFVKRIRRWVAERSSKTFTNSAMRTRHKSMGEIEGSTSKNKGKISQGLQNEITDYQHDHPGTGKHGNSHAGNNQQGTNYPGNSHQGTNNPGNSHQGTNYPKNSHQGTNHPGNSHQGTNHPGNSHQGTNHPGNSHQGTNHPGNSHQGTNQPGNSHQGSNHPGNSQQGNNHGINQHGNQGNPHGSGAKNPNSNRKERKNTKRQLFTPQNVQSASPVLKSSTPKQSQSPDEPDLFNFLAPSWTNFKFDKRAILDCLT